MNAAEISSLVVAIVGALGALTAWLHSRSVSNQLQAHVKEVSSETAKPAGS